MSLPSWKRYLHAITLLAYLNLIMVSSFCGASPFEGDVDYSIKIKWRERCAGDDQGLTEGLQLSFKPNSATNLSLKAPSLTPDSLNSFKIFISKAQLGAVNSFYGSAGVEEVFDDHQQPLGILWQPGGLLKLYINWHGDVAATDLTVPEQSVRLTTFGGTVVLSNCFEYES